MGQKLRICIAVLAAACAAAAAPAALAYPWPIRPFDQQHPVRGAFGDPRIFAGHLSFHSGVDIAAPAGTPVYAVVSGPVFIDPAHPMNVAILGAREFSYWHVVPAVVPGQWAVAYRTVIGFVTTRWLHVHFCEWSGGVPINPLREGGLEPYDDDTVPTVHAVSFERGGRVLDQGALWGAVDVVVETSDPPALSAPAPWANMPLVPALLRWRVLGRGEVVRPWQTAVDFLGALPPRSLFDRIYAAGTRENDRNWPGRYRLYLMHRWNVSSLPAGDYRLQAEAVDTAGNIADSIVPFGVTDWRGVPR